MTIVADAFDVAAEYGRGKRPSDADLAVVFEALDVLYRELSKPKKKKLRPPAPKKRGRKLKWGYYGWWIKYIIEREQKNGATVADAIKTMQRELQAYGIDVPVDDDTIRLYRNRSKLRPHLLPKPNK